MEIVLIIAVILVLVAIVALLFLKKRQALLDEKPTVLVDRSKTQPDPSASDAGAQSVHSAKAPAQEDALKTASVLFNEQRYDDAIHLLKRHLMTRPKDAQAMLKLLQIYGITNNISAFDQLHRRIHSFGDPEIIEQADFCRSLLEEELQDKACAATSAPAAKLDFDLNDDDGQPNATTQDANEDDLTLLPVEEDNAASEEVHDFSDSFDLSFEDETAAETPSDEAQQGQSDDAFDLDFDLGDFGAKAAAEDPIADATGDADAAETLESLNEFSLEDPSDNEASQDDALDFAQADETTETALSFEDFELETPKASDELTPEDNAIDVDFALEETSGSTDTPVAQTDSDDAFDLDDILGDDLTFEQPQEPKAKTPEPETADVDLDLDFSDLDLDGDLSEDPKTHESANNDLEPDGGIDDLAFGEIDDLASDDAKVETKNPEDALDFSDLDLNDDLSLDEADNEATIPDLEPKDEIVSEAKTHDEAQALADFAFELDDDALQETFAVDDLNAEESPQTDDALSFDFVDDTPANEQADIREIQESSDAIGDFDFAIEDQPHETTQTATQEVAAPIAASATPDPRAADLVDDSRVDAPAATLSPAPKADNLKDDLSFTQDLNVAQVTLALAQQYMDLGEQDSAQRLLEEVLHSATGDEKQTAQRLLDRLR